ncbi:hypothetical protein [Streptomyces sp. NPDC050504]|uniref:hypothetical protein n=1 Tax=Streptomyces sp. NPDC050504 TaxID=3365618 RepID=UPI0037982705
MFRNRTETVLLALREADAITEALRGALESAPEAERAGLERALAVVAEATAADDAALKARWVRKVLAEAGCEEAPDSVAAIKALRAAEPGLSLLQAVTLAKAAAPEKA